MYNYKFFVLFFNIKQQNYIGKIPKKLQNLQGNKMFKILTIKGGLFYNKTVDL